MPDRSPRLRLFLVLLCGLAVLPAANSPSRAGEDRAPRVGRLHSTPPAPRVEEFPPNDIDILQQLRRGRRAKEAARRLAEAPDDPETVRWLIDAGRIRDVAGVVERIVRTRPHAIAPTLETLSRQAHEFRWYQIDSPAETLLALARQGEQSDSLSREERARVMRWNLVLDRQLGRKPGRDYRKSLEDFLERCAGTEAALLTRIELLGAYENRGPGSLWALRKLAGEQVGTVVGAKALLYQCYALDTGNERLKTDSLGVASTKAFVELVHSVAKLESGMYPPCLWVDRAPGVVRSFYFRFPPTRTEDIDTVLAVCKTFLRTHLEVDTGWPLGGGAVYLLAGKMGGFFDLRADRVGGVERTLDELERTSKNPDRIRYLRALCYLYFLRNEPAGAESTMFEKARVALSALGGHGREPWRHRAVAILASLYFGSRDYAAAEKIFGGFVHRYPKEGYAWVAALRAGQCAELQGDLDRALVWYRKTASDYWSEPMALILSEAHAGHCLEGLGRFAEALAAYRRALAGWDDDYGPELRARVDSRHRTPTVRLAHEGGVSKVDLRDRVAVLDRSLSMPGGEDLEAGRWLLDQKRWDEARVALEAVITRHPGSQAASEARFLDHLARLQTAMDLADVEGAAPDSAAARAVLETITAEPYDLGVSLAGIALACLAWNERDTTRAESLMTRALESWRTGQAAPVAPESLSVLERNVVEIRDLVFHPHGKRNAAGVLPPHRPGIPPYLIVDPEVLVTTADGHRFRLTLRQSFSGADSVLFARQRWIGYLSRIINALGGTKKRRPASIMTPPNQPGGGARAILEFWNRFFPCRPGHWQGWLFQASPMITTIEFLNPELTRAAVSITTGYDGRTIVVRKEAGVWKVEKVVGEWIT